ncbi:MAG: glycosyltransferase family 39 protein [Chloroflexi bacterium]|nr:glycosyltransferase family 39 protein [Chloroflexota bacterium]
MTSKKPPQNDISKSGGIDQFLHFSIVSKSKSQPSFVLSPGSRAKVTNHIPGPEVEDTKPTRKEYTHRESQLPDETTPGSSIQKAKKISIFGIKSIQNWLIAAAVVVYLVTRMIGLDSYPIYFFTDEAAQTVLAADLVRDGFHSYTGEFLPTFVENGGQYEMGASVYLQILPYLIFGKSIWVTRGISALLTLLAVLSVGLILKSIFGSRFAFAGILFLSVTPAWFLHSRTAFETALAVSFYSVFLFTYLKYREGSFLYLAASIFFGALCFYCYSPAQLVMVVTAFGLLVSDWRCHLRNWKKILLGLGMACLFSLPYIRFMILHPEENIRQLQILNSYWIQSLPITKKLAIYFLDYLKLLNPFYWFVPNSIDLERHVMKNYGHILRWTFPFFVVGFVIAMRKFKDARYRVFLISLLAAPTGAALVGAGITRTLFMVIPVAILTTLGLEQVWKWIERSRFPGSISVAVTFLSLATLNIFMLADALTKGPLWYPDYTLSGQQYGARQVFGEIKQMLKGDPTLQIYLSPSWTNGTDEVARFFFDDPLPFQMGGIESYLYEKREIGRNQVFILMPAEKELVRESGKFSTIEELNILKYPSGEPGFFFLKLKYVDNIDEILSDERIARKELIKTELITGAGDRLVVQYPALDMGTIENLFDGNQETLVRTREANPLNLEIQFADAKWIDQISVRIGGTASTLTVEIHPGDGSQSMVLKKEVLESNNYRDILFKLDQTQLIKEIEITILSTYEIEPSHVHVWEVSFQ